MSAPHPQPTGLFLEGEFVAGSGTREVRNPYSGGVIAEVAVGGIAEIHRAVASAQRHLPPMAAAQRAEILERAAGLVNERRERFATTICNEAGKPLRQARAEVDRCIDTLIFSAVEARTLVGEMVPMDGSRSGHRKIGFTTYAPVGVIGAISPFNFPLNLVAHKVGPAIAAGCPVVLKPAEITPLSSLLLAEVFRDAGLPAGALSVVTGDGAVAGAALVDHPDVAMISFTGSAAVGWAIRARAPKKHVALELGNSTPVIVTEDADLDHAVARIVGSGFTHAGQSCVSVQRVYIHESIYDEVCERLVTAMSALVVGDPSDPATDVGPVISSRAHDRIVAALDEAVAQGARILAGGASIAGLLMPTLIADITPTMTVSAHEIFGPVIGVATYRTIDGAIALANATSYGLQAGIFTGRVDAALTWAPRLAFAGVTINETPTFRADQQPYGGIKESGNTREGPRAAVRNMCEQRLVIIDLPAR